MFELIRANKIRSAALVMVIAVLLVMTGYFLAEAIERGAGPFGVVVAMIVWVVMSLGSYYGGDKVILSIAGARKISKADNPQLFNVVEEMQIAAGLPKLPDIYVIDDPAPNAFATGRDPGHAVVAVTTGLLAKLNRDELQGVIAHEISHVWNRDILFMMMAGVMVGVIVLICDLGCRQLFWFGGRRRRDSRGGGAEAAMMIIGLVLAILAPLMAQMLYLAVSRRREYLADACGAQLTRYPEGLASALEKIAGDRQVLQSANRATAPLYIVNPIKKFGELASNISSTHPPISERVAILRGMAGGASLADYYRSWSKTGDAPSSLGIVAKTAPPVAAREASEEQPHEGLDRLRTATDSLRAMGGFLFLSCPCGARLKIPPAFQGPEVACPRCGRQHALPSR